MRKTTFFDYDPQKFPDINVKELAVSKAQHAAGRLARWD